MKLAGSIMHPCDEGVIVSTPATAPCSPRAASWVLAATILGSSLAFIDSTVVNVALPALQANFNATVVDVQWVVEAYALLLAALLLAGGSLGDIYGRKRIKLAAIEVPAQVDKATREAIRRSIDESFVAGFRVVMVIASGLALGSAATAWLVIRDKP